MKDKKTRLEIIEVESSGIKGFSGGAWSFYFMYTKYHGNFILSGYHKEVEEYIKKKKYTHYFYNWTGFSDGESRSFWSFWLDDVGIFEPSKDMGERKRGKNKWRSKYLIRWYSCAHGNNKHSMELKRMPHKWIPEFDQF